MADGYIRKYRSTVQKEVDECSDLRNVSQDIGCYSLHTVYNNETYVFDATALINDPGRYINHVRRNCNLVLMPPMKIGVSPKSQLHIGFVVKTKY